MPNISYNKQGGVIVWDKDDFIQGLHPQYSTSSSAVRLGKGMAFQQAYNPYRYLGAMLPGAIPTNATNSASISEFLRNVVVNFDNSSNNAYFVSNGDKVQKITTITSPLVIETTGWPHSINSNANSEAGQDIILYNANVSSVSTKLMFVSYNNSAKGDVSMYNFSSTTATWDDDFMSTVPSGAATLSKSFPHPMIVGDDDVLYIGNCNILAGFDGSTGANGTFTPVFLTLPAGYVITSFARLQNTLVIYAYFNNGSSFYLGNSKAFFWDYLALDPINVIDLTDNYVSAGFQYKTTIGCFTQGRNETGTVSGASGIKPSKLKLWDGNGFNIKASFDENIPIHGGVDVLGDTINWNAGGTLYEWGTPYPNDTSISFNKLTTGSGTTSGVLRTLTTDIQAMSCGATTSGGLQEVDTFFTGFYDGAGAALPTAQPDFPFGTRGRIKTARIQFAYTVADSGSNRDLVFRIVRAGTTSGSDITTLIADTDDFRSVGINNLIKEFTTDNSAQPLPTFTSLRPDIFWNTGSGGDNAIPVEKIEIEYELVIYQNV